MAEKSDPQEALRAQVLALLAREGRPMHTGVIACALGVLTHQVHSSLHHPYQTGKVLFASSEGWSLPAKLKPEPPDGQTQIV